MQMNAHSKYFHQGEESTLTVIDTFLHILWIQPLSSQAAIEKRIYSLHKWHFDDKC